MPMHPNTMRVGKRYGLRNYREEHRFEVEEALERNNFRLKDLDTLERYQLKELMAYGRGEDFDLWEIPFRRS